MRCFAFLLAYVLLLIPDGHAQEITLSPTVEIGITHEEPLTRVGGMVSLTDDTVWGVAIKASTALTSYDRGICIDVGPTIRVFNGTHPIHVIPMVGISRVPFSPLNNNPNAPRGALMIKVNSNKVGLLAGAQQTFKGSTQVNGERVTNNPGLAAIIGLSITL